MAHTIIPIVEQEMGIKCFPDLATCWHYDDKIRQYYILKQHGFPAIESWVFWNKKKALEWIETASFPLVFKLKSGSASHSVLLVQSKRRAAKLIRKMFGKGTVTGNIGGWKDARAQDTSLFKALRRKGGEIVRKLKRQEASYFWQKNKNYALFQKFLPDNKYDTRVVVIGKRAFAFRRFNRKNDFRASGSNNKDLNPDSIDREFLKLAFVISTKLKFQCMAYDFLYDENKLPQVVEMSYTFPDTTIPHCPGYWDDKLVWHKGKNWAQYFQLMDLLNMPGLKQPPDLED
jgi:glutathione synthase/RimK-type ligase-like ATP-grasp enzyme